MTAVQAQATDLAEEQTVLSAEVGALRSQVDILTRSVEAMESRRRNVWIQCIPESITSGDLLPYANRLARQVLGTTTGTLRGFGAIRRIRMASAAPRDVIAVTVDVIARSRLM